MVRLPRNEKHIYQQNSIHQMQSLGLTLAMTWTFKVKCWNKPCLRNRRANWHWTKECHSWPWPWPFGRWGVTVSDRDDFRCRCAMDSFSYIIRKSLLGISKYDFRWPSAYMYERQKIISNKSWQTMQANCEWVMRRDTHIYIYIYIYQHIPAWSIFGVFCINVNTDKEDAIVGYHISTLITSEQRHGRNHSIWYQIDTNW